MAVHPKAAQIAVSDLLAQVSCEMAALAAQVERLEGTVSVLLADGPVEPDILRQAQALDYVFQHMTELGDLVARTARQADAGWCVAVDPILSPVTLSALALRLSGTASETVTAGEMELF